MSDRMTPIPFDKLIHWMLTEKQTRDTMFGIRKSYIANQTHALELFDRHVETPFGPAAGPHTQLAQNLVAAYYAGSRFFELKTVQVLDGEDLPVSKPCIKAEDEGYNVEWSTELRVPEAFEEYVKGWFAISLLAKEYNLGSIEGFVFNMSVGYDLEGIKTKKIDDFIEGLKEAKDTTIYKECKEYLLNHLHLFKNVTASDVEDISSQICNSITLSTLHGCPPKEIERIATYLIEEKKLHTFIKCNPTLLGFEFTRKILDDMGYDYVAFGEFHFKDDLQYEDAIPMLHRILALAETNHLSFGVKLTNTFPVDIKENELPGTEMYMSGRSLYPLSIALAAKLSREFEGKLRISYSGGADVHNIKEIFDTGIWPITIATTILKPGGYERMVQIAELFKSIDYTPFAGINPEAVQQLQLDSTIDSHHLKSIKPLPSRKMIKKVPLTNCFVAPCKEGCPIHQDIPTYLKLTGEGRYLEALKVITEKNPLPFITGTICAHNCMSKCTRNFYDESVHIRDMKLEAAKGGYEELLKEINQKGMDSQEVIDDTKVAVIGGGPAGLATAFFLARSGVKVTIFEKKETLGGVIRHIIPEFRISDTAIDNDIELVKHMGVEIKVNTEVSSIDEIGSMGYSHIVLALGATKPGALELEHGETVNAISFLEDFKRLNGHIDLGKNVVIIGGGNTAMDTARAAKRIESAQNVSLVYRRTKRLMPAEEEELILAMKEGVEFLELLAPFRIEQGMLLCHKMILGEPDASFRRRPIKTNDVIKIPADTVIAAVGEKIDTTFYQNNGIATKENGCPIVDPTTLETSRKGVYVVGDGVKGPASVVEAIRDGSIVAEAILNKSVAKDITDYEEESLVYAKRGIVKDASLKENECDRCLVCSSVCENCVEVCPNRANLSIHVPGMAMAQILHVDRMCNECGNCASFCPYDSAPYKEKFTLFHTVKEFEESNNQGFLLVDPSKLTFHIRLKDKVITQQGLLVEDGVDDKVDDKLDKQIQAFIATVYQDYNYLF